MQGDDGPEATEGKTIPFEPNEMQNDVVSTKYRDLNRDHPGNIFYNQLLSEHVERLRVLKTSKKDEILNQSFWEITDQIVMAITGDRGGRFLKLPGGEKNPKVCRIMTYKESHHKVLTALKTAYSKKKKLPIVPTEKRVLKRKLSDTDEPGGKKKKGNPKVVVQMPESQLTRRVPPSKAINRGPPANIIKRGLPTRKKSGRPAKNPEPQTPEPAEPPKPQIRYEAKIGEDRNIHPYALELISVVCNSPESIERNEILDSPLPAKYSTLDDEPDYDRRIRMQLRHRYFAAKAIRMSAIDLSRRLLEVWGGNLLEVEEKSQTVDEKIKADTVVVPPQPLENNAQDAVASSSSKVQPQQSAGVEDNNFVQASTVEPVVTSQGGNQVAAAVAQVRSSDVDEGEYETATETSFHEAEDDDASDAKAAAAADVNEGESDGDGSHSEGDSDGDDNEDDDVEKEDDGDQDDYEDEGDEDEDEDDDHLFI